MKDDVETSIQEAIAREPRLAGECRSLSIELHPDVLVLDGIVETIAAKRRLVLLATKSGGGLGVLDRVRVEAATEREDAEIAASFLDALAQEPIFTGYRALSLRDDALDIPENEADEDSTADELVIGVAVNGGTVRLVGRVGSLTHRRFAEVLSWWIAGTVDVDNHLYVVQSEEDSDAEITDAVRMALQKDPWLDATNLEVCTRGREVHLAGVLPSSEQRDMAECDAWYVRGVHGVINDIEVEP